MSAPTIRTQNLFFEIAAGNAPAFYIHHAFGASLAVGDTLQVVSTADVYQMPSSPVSLEALSDDAADTAAGSGARSIVATGLGPGWVEQTMTAPLDGVTPAAVPGTWLRVWEFAVYEAGTYGTSVTGSHNSTITLRASGGGATWATILTDGATGLGRSLIGALTTPINSRAWIVRHPSLSAESQMPVDAYIMARQRADVATSPIIQLGTVRGVLDRYHGAAIPPAGPYAGPCDIYALARTTVGATPGDTTVTFEVVIERL